MVDDIRIQIREATVGFCASLGYDAFVLKGARLVHAGVHDDNLYNYFFIPCEQKFAQRQG